MQQLSRDELFVVYEYLDLKSILNFSLVSHDASKWLVDGNSLIWSPASHRFTYYTQLNPAKHTWKIDQYLQKFGTYKGVIQQFMLYRFCDEYEDENKWKHVNTFLNHRRTLKTNDTVWQTFKINVPLELGTVYSWDFVLDEYSDKLNTYNVLLGLSTFQEDARGVNLKKSLVGCDSNVGISLNVGRIKLHYGCPSLTSFAMKQSQVDLQAKAGDVFTFILDTKGSKYHSVTRSKVNLTLYLNGSLLTSLAVSLHSSEGHKFYPGISTIHAQTITLRPSHLSL